MAIFISYVRGDQREAEALAHSLSVLGVDAWLNSNSLVGGVTWSEEIERAIAEADLFVVLISENSRETQESYYYKEIELALDRLDGLASGLAFVVPIRVDGATPTDRRLERLQCINVYRQDETSFNHAAQNLLEILQKWSLARRKYPVDEISDAVQHILHQTVPEQCNTPPARLTMQICQRVESISESIKKTAESNQEVVDKTVDLFSEWMLDGTVVRLIGAGRAKLSGAIPANRLAHGGARVYVQDDMIPMPHTIKQGGVIAVSASGRSASVLHVLRQVRAMNPGILIVGIADKTAKEFRGLCDLFIGIESSDLDNPLQALADSNEYVCSMLLDAMVVAAGNRSGFDDTTWRLGHENLGATGPYDLGEK